MSYEVYYLDSEFIIKNENFGACMRAIEEYHKSLVPDIQCPGGALAYPEKVLEKKIAYALTYFGWPPEINEDGVWNIYYKHDRRGNIGLLRAIAKYVEAGSVIEYIGEDGKACKIEFKNNSIKEFEGQIIYQEKSNE